MTVSRLLPVSAAVLFGLSGNAFASSSNWVQMEGGRVRLVTAGAVDAESRLHGVLEIQLQPGWKTYWRDPGDAGVPPIVDVSASTNIRSAELAFPVPERHHDGAFSWAGYAQSVSLPLTFTVDDPAKPPMLNASVFLGICESICVPLNATLIVDPQSDPGNQDEVAVVSAAISALPPAATEDFGLRTVNAGDKTLTVEAVVPDGTKATDVFIAADQGYYFQAPKPSGEGGKARFTLEVTKPDAHPPSGGFHYTLVTDNGAVSGILPYF